MAKRETGSLIIATKEEAVQTNYRRERIERDGSLPLCRMRKQADEAVDHIVSGCRILAQTEYKVRHNWVATAVYWWLAKKYRLPHSNQWYRQMGSLIVINGTYIWAPPW